MRRLALLVELLDGGVDRGGEVGLWRDPVDRHPYVTPMKQVRSIAYRADRRPDPMPNHTAKLCNMATRCHSPSISGLIS